MIAFRRSGGLRRPQFDESLEIQDDGSFELWRSVSSATSPPTPVGRFGGRLDDAQRSDLESAAAEAAAEGPRTWTVVPDSPVDRVRVGDVDATLGMRDKGEGGWATLLGVLRPLLRDLTGSAVAAIALEVGDGARLVHLGSEPAQLDLASLEVEAVQWRDDDSVGHWTATDADADELTAGPGWRRELPFDHGFQLDDGDRVAVQVRFSLRAGDRWVPVSLQTP